MKNLDFSLVVFTFIAAVLSCVCGELLLYFLRGNIHDILMIGLYFGLCGLIFSIMLHICVYGVSSIKAHIPVPSGFRSSIAIYSVIAFVIMFALSAFFQFSYSVGRLSVSTKNYLVAVDNSGSMNQNDPEFKRYDALKDLFSLINRNQSIGVYTFNENQNYAFPIRSISPEDISNFDGIFSSHKKSSGLTDFMSLMKLAAKEIKDSNLEGSASFILISDGEAEVEEEVLLEFIELKIPVHTIAVSVSENTDSLIKISEYTMGIHYNIENVEKLTEVFNDIYDLTSEHNLIDARTGINKDSVLYSIMRITLITLLALIVRLLQVFVIDIKQVRKPLIIQGILFSILIACVTEYLFQMTNISQWIVRFIMLFGLMIIFLNKIDIKYSFDEQPDL